MRRLVRTVLSLAAAGALVAAPGPATAAEPEPWQPYEEGALTLPADRYCGAFDLRSTPVKQDIKFRVVDRYDSGAVRTEEYTGLLLVEVENLATGASTQADMSGRAFVTYREDGSLATYEMEGPIGMGWPSDEGYERGFYLMNGHHVVGFDEDGSRSILLDDGTETNFCDILS